MADFDTIHRAARAEHAMEAACDALTAAAHHIQAARQALTDANAAIGHQVTTLHEFVEHARTEAHRLNVEATQFVDNTRARHVAGD